MHRSDTDSCLTFGPGQALGTTEAELLETYPTLSAADLANAWAYACAHHEEIDQQIHANETA